MVFGEDAPRPKDEFKPRLLENLSVPELNLYIKELKEEITRVEADIAKKESYKSAADSFFKS